MSRLKGLYFITDSELSEQGIVADVQQVIEAGCRMVQYREKQKSSRKMLQEAKQLIKICREKDTLFIVNDRLDIALAAGADGVHLGQDDLPVSEARRLLGKEKIIGTSNHCLRQAKQSIAHDVDYLSVGPIFHTDTKKDVCAPVGISLLKQIRALTELPLVAIGGINEENLEQVLDAGPDAIAMISAIVCSGDVGEAAKRTVEKIGRVKKGKTMFEGPGVEK